MLFFKKKGIYRGMLLKGWRVFRRRLLPMEFERALKENFVLNSLRGLE